MTEVILGIDTSTKISVGLARDGVGIAGTMTGDSRSHAEKLMPAIEAIMTTQGIAMRELTGIGVGMGPGPYTGLRVGIVTATTLASILGIPVYHVCSLDVLALTVLTHGGTGVYDPGEDFITCTDARRKELYWACYNREGVRQEGPVVSDPGELPDLVCYGPGTLVYPGLRSEPRLAGSHPSTEDLEVHTHISAMVLAMKAQVLPDVGSQPLYLRYADVAEPGTTKSVLPTSGGSR